MRPHLKKTSFQAVPEPTLAEWKTFSSGTEEPVLADGVFVFIIVGILYEWLHGAHVIGAFQC